MPAPQNFKNHARFVPIYHIGVFLPFLANFFWAAYRLTNGVTTDSVISLLVAIGLLLMFFSVRVQILTVQDRVIRLEMRLRLHDLLPADLSAKCAELPVGQLVALRFASDAELPALAREVLAGNLSSQKQIKQRVKDWQADYQRA